MHNYSLIIEREEDTHNVKLSTSFQRDEYRFSFCGKSFAIRRNKFGKTKRELTK